MRSSITLFGMKNERVGDENDFFGALEGDTRSTAFDVAKLEALF